MEKQIDPVEFEDFMLECVEQAELDIEDYDVCNSEHYDEMMDNSIDLAYNHYTKLGYTMEQFYTTLDEYYD